MQYGHFSKNGKEYIITRPDTPKPWFNYLFNELYHVLTSQTGGGYSYYDDPKSNRILRYEHIQTDRPGRYVYLRDEETGEFWSVNWQPVRKAYDAWETRHGLGYTTLLSRANGIEGKITYLVAQDSPVELWMVKIKNLEKRPRRIRAYPFVEFISGDIELETCYRNILSLYNEAYYDERLKAIIARKYPFRRGQAEWLNFFSTSARIHGFETSKESFIGRYNDLSCPNEIREGALKKNAVRGEDMVGVFESRFHLGPKEEVSFVVCLGFARTIQEAASYLRKYRREEVAEEELLDIKSYWEGVVDRIRVHTPDPNFDLMVNIWGKYQLFAIIHSRGTSSYHGTEGGLGYRDTAQDSEGLLALRRDAAIEKIEKLLFYQYHTGHAVSGFSYSEGSWDKNHQAVVTGKADVAVWLPYTIISYIKETGDVDFLKKKYRFHDGGEATVYEHIKRAVRYLYQHRGKHGLPFIRKADWNDAYDHVGIGGKGESIWLGMALARACRQMESLAHFLKDRKTELEMRKKYQTLNQVINRVGWDGGWYLAAFNDEGYRIGSAKNEEGRVPLNSQTWAILSGVAPPDREKKILKLIDEYLDTAYGPALFLPSYTRFNPGIGRVTAFAEGTKENAAVFSHACAFKIVADCTIGRGDKAYETFTKLYPMSPAKSDHTQYTAEPYVWAEYVVGPGSRSKFGEGNFTWNTGTTPWMFIAATEWILGVRREFEGLLIDPCLPRHWKRASIRRPFRGSTYEVTLLNPEGVEKGVKQIFLDGKKWHSNLIPPHGDGKLHRVKVVMGHAGKRSKRSER
ncbi:MAG: hypothetical protein HY590_00095 [Candidatus Omnitrophica bacterium]|nr:hypothetical protein [Candidatus Omnitrophota bacterium]